METTQTDMFTTTPTEDRAATLAWGWLMEALASGGQMLLDPPQSRDEKRAFLMLVESGVATTRVHEGRLAAVVTARTPSRQSHQAVPLFRQSA